jgi:hypothetical protein
MTGSALRDFADALASGCGAETLGDVPNGQKTVVANPTAAATEIDTTIA